MDTLHVITLAVNAPPNATARPLRYADADADAFATRMATQTRYAHLSTTQLSATHDRHTILDTAAQIADVADSSDALVFFYAGHGLVEADERGGASLHLMCDGVSATEIPTTAVPVDTLLDTLGQTRCPSVLTVLDCCDSGRHDARSFIGPQAMRLLETSRGFHRRPVVPQGTGRIVFSASRQGTAAIESTTLRHGLFTAGLLHALRARRGRSTAPAVDVLQEARDHVLRTSAGTQCPTWAGRDDGLHVPLFARRTR